MGITPGSMPHGHALVSVLQSRVSGLGFQGFRAWGLGFQGFRAWVWCLAWAFGFAGELMNGAFLGKSIIPFESSYSSSGSSRFDRRSGC